jgi:uncharacterized membrane protein YkvA (DUF1232 family)
MEKNKSWDKAAKEAESLAKDPEAVELLADRAHKKARDAEEKMGGVRKDFDSLVRMSRAWATGKYKDVSWASILLVLGTVIYFVNPIDAIPDFLPFMGLTDDLSVIAFALSRVKKELNKFREWETEIILK